MMPYTNKPLVHVFDCTKQKKNPFFRSNTQGAIKSYRNPYDESTNVIPTGNMGHTLFLPASAKSGFWVCVQAMTSCNYFL